MARHDSRPDKEVISLAIKKANESDSDSITAVAFRELGKQQGVMGTSALISTAKIAGNYLRHG